MNFVRIKSYYQNGKFTNCEHLYIGSDQVKSLERFRKEYPEHDNCILVAEHYDSEDLENIEHFKICSKCGCVHYW